MRTEGSLLTVHRDVRQLVIETPTAGLEKADKIDCNDDCVKLLMKVSDERNDSEASLTKGDSAIRSSLDHIAV
mgnify:CR=1 FL=1